MSTVKLMCMGDIGPRQYLDGRTANGTVGLVTRDALESVTGTNWELIFLDNSTVTLKCLGDIDGSRYLEGRPGDGTVGLAPGIRSKNDPRFTGTLWTINRLNNIVATFECLGEGNVDDPRYLDGRTANGTIGLAPKTNADDPVFTGTAWYIQ
jgi:hypothetical protein